MNDLAAAATTADSFSWATMIIAVVSVVAVVIMVLAASDALPWQRKNKP